MRYLSQRLDALGIEHAVQDAGGVALVPVAAVRRAVEVYYRTCLELTGAV